MFPFSSVFSLGILGLLTWSHVLAFRCMSRLGYPHIIPQPAECLFLTATIVPIADTDSLREVCSGMWGGKDAYIQGMSPVPIVLLPGQWSDCYLIHILWTDS